MVSTCDGHHESESMVDKTDIYHAQHLGRMIASSIIRKESLTLRAPRLQTLIILSEFDSFRLGVGNGFTGVCFLFLPPLYGGIAVNVFLILLFVLYPRTDLNRDTGLFNLPFSEISTRTGFASQYVSQAHGSQSKSSLLEHHLSFPVESSILSRSITG